MRTTPAGNRSAALIAALLGLCAVLLAGCATGDDAVVTGQGNQIVSPDGKTVIDYPIADREPIGTLTGEALLGGDDIDLDTMRGDVVVVNVWATWCPPCRKEFPILTKVYEQTRDQGVSFVGIAFRDNRSSAQDFVKDRKVPYPSIYDYGGRTLAVLDVPVGAVPTTVILDRQLRPAKVFVKAVTEEELSRAVQAVVAEDDPAK